MWASLCREDSRARSSFPGGEEGLRRPPCGVEVLPREPEPGRTSRGWSCLSAVRLQPRALAHAQRPRRRDVVQEAFLRAFRFFPSFRAATPGLAAHDRPQRLLDLAARQPREGSRDGPRGRRRACGRCGLCRGGPRAARRRSAAQAGARRAARRIPRSDRCSARARGPLVPGDRRSRRSSGGNRDVAPRTGAAASPVRRSHGHWPSRWEHEPATFPREHAHAWLDGELSVEATLEAERHARECASCAAEYRRRWPCGLRCAGAALRPCVPSRPPSCTHCVTRPLGATTSTRFTSPRSFSSRKISRLRWSCPGRPHRRADNEYGRRSRHGSVRTAGAAGG